MKKFYLIIATIFIVAACSAPTNNSDIRWQQRRQNFERALEKLEQACPILELNELEAQGLIKAFEYTHELA